MHLNFEVIMVPLVQLVCLYNLSACHVAKYSATQYSVATHMHVRMNAIIEVMNIQNVNT